MANRGGKPSNHRADKRKDRNQRVGTRVPELGYYLIMTDTKETEKNYSTRTKKPFSYKSGKGKDCRVGK